MLNHEMTGYRCAMPALTAPATGASGFIGTWIVGDLLKRGFSVRASVRSESKGKHLLGLFSSYADKLTLTIVPDMEAVCLHFTVLMYSTYLIPRLTHSMRQ